MKQSLFQFKRPQLLLLLNTILRVTSFGFLATGIENSLLFSRTQMTDSYMIGGLSGWIFFTISKYALEKKYNDVDDTLKSEADKSIFVLTEVLTHTAGFGPVNSITNFANGNDTTTANIGYLTVSLLISSTVIELNKTVILKPPPLKHEFFRFILLLLADFAKTIAMRQFINVGFNAWYLIPLGVSVVTTISELIYGRRVDTKLSLGSTLVRRAIKLNATFNLIFPIYNFANGTTENLDIFDNCYQIFLGLSLAASTTKFYLLAAKNKRTEQETDYERLESPLLESVPSPSMS